MAIIALVIVIESIGLIVPVILLLITVSLLRAILRLKTGLIIVLGLEIVSISPVIISSISPTVVVA